MTGGDDTSPADQQERFTALETLERALSNGWAPTSTIQLREGLNKKLGLSLEEVLIADYACALQKRILLSGRMYIFSRCVCFHSSLLGYETIETIPLVQISAIEKRTTALIVQNAILVTTRSGARHFFQSFFFRDEAYKQLVGIWHQVLEDTKRNGQARGAGLGDEPSLGRERSISELRPRAQSAAADLPCSSSVL